MWQRIASSRICHLAEILGVVVLLVCFGIGIKAGLDWIPTSGSGIVLVQNGAGDYFGVGATTTTLGAKTAGKAASAVLGVVSAVKLTADIANYFGSLVACSLDPLKRVTFGNEKGIL